MKNLILLFILFATKISAQTCIDTLWQERNGLAIIECETHPQLNGWLKKDSVAGFTGTGYIVWQKAEYFTNAANGRITFKVKINTPGRYAFDWRVGISNGNLTTEHNDTWLRITGVDNFWAEKLNNPSSVLKPKPECNNDPVYKCPNGSSVSNYFKIYGGTLYSFTWKASTSDNDDHKIFFDKNTEGVISINIAARSSHQMLDRMVIYRLPDVASRARNLSNTSTTNCTVVSTSNIAANQVQIFPNPTTNSLSIQIERPYQLMLINAQGSVLTTQNWQAGTHDLDLNNCAAGVYWLRFINGNQSFTEKILKFD